MGCARSKFHSSALEESDDRPEATKTCCCWTGIKKCFSKSKKSTASSEVMEDDVNSNDDSDDVILVNDISEASVASSQSVNDSEPRVLRKSRSALALGTSPRTLHALAAAVRSAPAVLGQDCHEVLMPSLREVLEKPRSPSYPKDMDVSTQAVQLYQHRDNVHNVHQESGGEIDDDVEEIIDTSSQTTQAMVVRRCNLVFRANIMITYDTDEVNIRLLSSQPGNAVTRRRRGNARAQITVAVSVDEVSAMYFISQLWAFIRNPFHGVYQAGLQTVQDGLMGTTDDTDVDEESAVIVHEGAGDHPLEERQPDLSSWTFICNVCFIAYHVGRQIVHDLFIGENVNEEEGSGDGRKEEGGEEGDGSGESEDEEGEEEEEK